MPLYEFIARDPMTSCVYCQTRFEVVRKLSEPPLSECPRCGGSVQKLVSNCQAMVIESSARQANVEGQLREHERAGRWSHAAELADTHAEKTKDSNLKVRALDNYKKAGYNTD